MKLKFYVLIAFAAVSFLLPSLAVGQGCVAVKNMSSCPLSYDSLSSGKGLQLSLNYRYFRSYKHFVGSHEETHRVEQGTEVINNDNSINFAVNYSLNRRLSASLVIPYIFIDRSSMYEHLGNAFPGQKPPNVNNPNFERFHTQSNGLGDVRLMGYYNLIPATRFLSLNVGLGVKLPTGKYDATDYFHKPERLEEGVVDQSIQRGDGGTGAIVEADLAINPTGEWGAYVSGMYLFNPRNTNEIKRRNASISKTQSGEDIANSDEFSVADQYMIRAGGRFTHGKFQAFAGGRMECIPSKDLIGKSEGFRRPGYIISLEPSVFYTFGNHTVGLNLPIALERNRTRSQIDIARGIGEITQPDGTKVIGPIHGDAAFADWLLSVTYAYRIALR